MSIYGTWLSLADDEHEEGCEVYVETPPGSGIFDFSGRPCDCGTPRSPIVYEGSHVLPSDDDPRGGSIDVASIPDFITRDGRDDAKGEGLKDWLRLSMDNPPSRVLYHGSPYVPAGRSVVLLDRRGVTELRDTLTTWLEREPITDSLALDERQAG